MSLTAVNLLILDVDGVLTDGSIALTGEGEVTKTFHVQDGYAVKLWQRQGGRVAIVSGRASEPVSRRAAELGIELVLTGICDKLVGYQSVLRDAGIGDEAVVYVGDDYPDLPPMRRCALPVAVANAVPTVKRAAAYVTRRSGGEGAVAEIVELILRKQNLWLQTGI